MKKIILVLCLIFMLSGCTKVNDLSYEELLQDFAVKPLRANKYRTGYKYYLPRGMQVTKSTLYNEKIEDDKSSYYLYIDIVSYYKGKEFNYKETSKASYSRKIEYEEKVGYLEINNLEFEQYLVEIMYNYAKIEVIVKEKDINLVVANSLSILASVSFNDNVLKTLLDEETSQFREFEFNIFETVSTADSGFLQAVTEEEPEPEDEIHDADLIN